MRNERHVQLRWETRAVVVDDPRGPAETMTYPGITVTRRQRGRVVDQLWLPVGDAEPTIADDEALVAVLRAAWCWNISAA
ncbi:hypothetical protein [Amycolatopsis sp. lyj-108]|uniref:hypothetical protein n=1 Tax=Amycolatopsis sp. lyj-108 TaxID=2789286 RepID=UPI00397A4BB8